EAAKLSHGEGYTVALSGGREIGNDLLETVRSTRVDARIVGADRKTVLVPPRRTDWAVFASDPLLTTPLAGADGKPVAIVEVAVSDGGLDEILRDITLTSVLLALGALAAVVLTGMLVARRTARDLDLLVGGSLAAAR